MDDNRRYDLTKDEFRPLILGLITAANIDIQTATTYWAETFPDYPVIPLEDLPSYLRLNGRVVGNLLRVIAEFHKEPATRPYVDAILTALRNA